MTEEKELDILTLFSKIFNGIGNFFKKMGRQFLYLVRFSYQNVIILAIFLFVGVAAGVAFSQLNRVYKSDITLRFSVSDASTLFDLTRSLDANVVSDRTLAEKLNLPDSVVDDIREIEPRFIIDLLSNNTPDFIDEDNSFVEGDHPHSRMQDRLNIEVRTRDVYSFPQIQEGLIHFFSSNERLSTERRIRATQLQEFIEFINNEVDRLGRLSEFEFFTIPQHISLTVDSAAVLLGERNRQLYHEDMVRLKFQRDSLSRVLFYTSEVVTVLRPFVPTYRNENGLIKMSLIFGFSFLFIGYIIAALRKYRKDVSEFLNS